jgi:hypothetical protein
MKTLLVFEYRRGRPALEWEGAFLYGQHRLRCGRPHQPAHLAIAAAGLELSIDYGGDV